jgi:hypothetical protein
MAELEQSHRFEVDKAALSTVKRGHCLGTFISALAIASSLASVYLGAHWSVSVALVGVPITNVVRAIILRR